MQSLPLSSDYSEEEKHNIFAGREKVLSKVRNLVHNLFNVIIH